MNLYTQEVIKKVMETIGNEKAKYFGVKLPSGIIRQPVYSMPIERNSELQLSELISGLINNSLIVFTKGEDDNFYYLEINCSAYFYDREYKPLDMTKHYPQAEFVRHFDNYDGDEELKLDNTKIDSNKITKQEIENIATNNLIVQIRKEILFAKSTKPNLAEMGYNLKTNTKLDYNTLYEFISSFAYNIKINISEVGDIQITDISFNYINKENL